MDDRPPFNLRDGLVHRYRVVLAVVALFLFVAGCLIVVLPRTYQATAIIYLDTARTATDFDSGIAAGDLLQHDFIVLATSRPTLLEACTAHGVSCPGAGLVAPETTIGKLVEVDIDRGTSSLAVTAKGPTPEEAAALANAVANAMIDQDAAEVVRLLKPARDDLVQQLSQLTTQMDAEQKALQESAPASTAAAAHQAALTRLQSEYDLASARLLDLEGRQDRLTNVATVVQPALPPTKPESPSPSLYLLAALVAGLAVGVFAALLIERFDNRIFSGAALEKAASVPVAFAIRGPRPALPSWLKLPLADPPGSNGNAYSAILASTLARHADARRVLVVAASGRDHSDSAADQLGAHAVESGERVAILHADGAHKAAPSEQMAGGNTVTLPQNGAATAAALAYLARNNEDGPGSGLFVLVSVPSPDTRPTGLLLGRSVKRAVLVATRGVTRFGDARRTADLLRQAGVDVVAGMLVPREPPAGR